MQWRPINEFPDYEVSENGQVRRGERMLKPRFDRKGYVRYSLFVDGAHHTRFAAPLVAAAYIGPKPKDQQVRHKDGNRTNNHWTNLEYGTRSDNELDKQRHGTTPFGEGHPSAKLTDAQVAEIRRRFKRFSRSDGTAALGREFGVHASTISMICAGKIRVPTELVKRQGRAGT